MKKQERIEALVTAMLRTAAIRAGEPELADRYLEHHARAKEKQVEHEHNWKPADGFPGRYACDCGATGYKPFSGKNRGEIVPHKNKTKLKTSERLHIGRPNLPGGNTRLGRRGPGSW